jgi:CDP-glycerol glycerophosphotransferase
MNACNKYAVDILRYFDYLSRLVKSGLFAFVFMAPAHVMKYGQRYRNVWLVSERPDEARDNGYHFFKYLVEKHPEIDVYYVIKSDSADFHKIEKLGKWIENRSLRHCFYYAICRVAISSHIHGAAPWGKAVSFFLKLLPRKLTVFLQHGIIYNHYSRFRKKNIKVDLFICGAKPEHEYLSANCGYRKNEIVYTGLARYDNLHRGVEHKRDILVMPTFRKWLFNYTRLQKDIAMKQFVEDDYYKYLQYLISSDTLIEMLCKYNYRWILYPHYSAQPFLSAFNAVSDRIVIASKEEYDVQPLLQKSAILITDFSSVFFDFAYMRKPVIYFQFDEEKFREGHYKSGYFSYEKDGFGPVRRDVGGVLSELEGILANSGLDGLYAERIKKFFLYSDNNNCQRIFAAIDNLIE